MTGVSASCELVPHGEIYRSDLANGKPFTTISIGGFGLSSPCARASSVAGAFETRPQLQLNAVDPSRESSTGDCDFRMRWGKLRRAGQRIREVAVGVLSGDRNGMRATRETELIALCPIKGLCPIKDLSSWLGNSAPIAMKHYAMKMNSSFDRAIQHGAEVVVRNPHKKPAPFAAMRGNTQHQKKLNDFLDPNKNQGKSSFVVLSET